MDFEKIKHFACVMDLEKRKPLHLCDRCNSSGRRDVLDSKPCSAQKKAGVGGVAAYLLVAGSILQPIYNYISEDVHSS